MLPYPEYRTIQKVMLLTNSHDLQPNTTTVLSELPAGQTIPPWSLDIKKGIAVGVVS